MLMQNIHNYIDKIKSNYNMTSSRNTLLQQIRNAHYHCHVVRNQLPTSQLSSINRAIFSPVYY